jgi:hypothetical protein
MPTVGVLYFGLLNPFHYSPLLPTHFSTTFSTYPYILYLPILTVYHSPFPEFQSSSTVTNMFYIWVYIYHLFLCMFIFGSIFHVWEKTLSFCFWFWLTSPNMLSFNCIHLPSNYMSLYPVAEQYSNVCIYTVISWSIHQLQDIWVVSRAWILWTVLQWTSMSLPCLLRQSPYVAQAGLELVFSCLNTPKCQDYRHA